ncbi:hypothetical protein [Chamaesiphon polymorphus]|uniref:hypothetical protein n=1 Tax=Chamaesiphon polymorphus TaxID=2107691 RepID=UPI0015E75484|nr:hypothetical protein [Chamaesiphon polymorphus]
MKAILTGIALQFASAILTSSSFTHCKQQVFNQSDSWHRLKLDLAIAACRL